MIRFLAGILLWLILIRFEVWRNYQLIEVEKERPNYRYSFAIRIVLGLFPYVLLIPVDVDPLLSLWDLVTDIPHYWKANPILVIPLIFANPAALAIMFEVSLFYLLFDPLFNIKRGRRWNYRGKSSGWLDKFPLPIYYGLKILCVVVLIVSSVRLWQNSI